MRYPKSIKHDDINYFQYNNDIVRFDFTNHDRYFLMVLNVFLSILLGRIIEFKIDANYEGRNGFKLY